MILLRKAHIYDVRSSHHDTIKDVLIERGQISRIAKQITAPPKAKVISSPSLSISPGWLDIGTYNGEPGYEYREDLDSLRTAASQGGYIALAPFPSGQPTIDSKGQLHFLKSQSEGHIVNIYPIAALTKKCEGKELAELQDLAKAGACAYSDGDATNMDQSQMIRAMQYLRSLEGLSIIPVSNPADGEIHEGKSSVTMGLVGIPAHHELKVIEEIVQAQKYAGGKSLIYNISTEQALKRVKRSNLDTTISVACLNLIYDENDVADFDINLKVSPPLRSSQDKKALIRAVQNGDINVITSHHRPLSKEEKDQPFGLAMHGASTLETVFGSLNTYTNLPIDRILHCLSVGPHEALGIPCQEIKVGSSAYLTLIDEKNKDVHPSLVSKGVNNPFHNKKMKGSILGLIRAGELYLHD